MKYHNLFSFYQIELGRKNYMMAILILVAVEILCAFSAIGYMAMPAMTLTSVHIVVIVGAMVLGPMAGGILGLVFGITSIWEMNALAEEYMDIIFSPYQSGNPVGSLILAIGTRVLFGVIAGYLFRWLFRSRKGNRCGFCVSVISVVSIWIYSFLLLVSMKIFFPEGIIQWRMIIKDVAVNNFLMWIVTALVVYAVNWFCSQSEVRRIYIKYARIGELGKHVSRKLVAGCIVCSVLLIVLLFVHMVTNLDQVMQIGGMPIDADIKFKVVNVILQFICAVTGAMFLLEALIVWVQSYTRLVTYENKEKQLEHEVANERRANQAKTSFLSTMSHDMRTPLNVIIGTTEIARENLDDREKIQNCMEEISLSGYQLLSLINNVLEMGKIESGALELNSVGFSLTRQLEKLERVIMHRVESRKQTFQSSQKWQHDSLKGDAIRLYQVLINVLSNAVKYAPEGGIVEFRVEEIPASRSGRAAYQFVVTDNGIGISAEFLKRMGEPFAREEDNAAVRRTQGSGLGVTIVKHILDAMGGSIEYESEPGRGTRVTICLEFDLEESSLSEETAGQTEKSADDIKRVCQGATLLVAEDNDLNWKIIEELLGYRGVRTHRAENGQECVEMFRASEPGTYQAILMDVQMPVMDGLKASMEIRLCKHREAGDIPIIAMTANAFSDDVDAAMKAGMNYYVSKPVDMEVLMKTLADALKK